MTTPDPQIIRTGDPNVDTAALEALIDNTDPDTVFVVHHYDTDDWHGAGQVFHTLRGAIAHASGDQDHGYDKWTDAHDVMMSGGHLGAADRHQLWWPTEQFGGEPVDLDSDTHPYIERQTVTDKLFAPAPPPPPPEPIMFRVAPPRHDIQEVDSETCWCTCGHETIIFEFGDHVRSTL